MVRSFFRGYQGNVLIPREVFRRLYKLLQILLTKRKLEKSKISNLSDQNRGSKTDCKCADEKHHKKQDAFSGVGKCQNRGLDNCLFYRILKPCSIGADINDPQAGQITEDLTFIAFICASTPSSAALKQCACVIAFSVRFMQSRISWPKKGQPTLPCASNRFSP